MQQPTSINLFALFFGCSAALSLVLALDAAQTARFGFALAPEAAETLAWRISAIRLLGVAFAVTLMLLVIFSGSRGARSALGLRWVLGLVTSVAFLRGIGVTVPVGGNGLIPIVLSIVQLMAEGFAILLLYGENAATWFDRGLRS